MRDPYPMRPSAPLPWVLIGLGLRLLTATGPRSTLAWLDWPLYAGLIGGLVLRMFGVQGLRLGPRAAGLAFVLLSLVLAGIFELSLTVDGTGWGGMHPDTRTSFVLALGDYLMLALACLGAVHWLRLEATGLFWLSCGVSLSEGLVFTGVVWQVPVPMVPLYLCYYALAYATFLVLPALILDPRPLWRDGPRRRPWFGLLIALGFAAAFAIRMLWGLVYAPLATALFHLEPAVS